MTAMPVAKGALAFAAALLIIDACLAGDPLADKLRAQQNKDVVLCSVNPKPPYLGVAEAMSKLKRGMTLRLAPGDYKTTLVIDQENVIVEGESVPENKDTFLRLEIKNEDCLLRGLPIDNVVFTRSLSLVDCVVNRLDQNDAGNVKRRLKVQAANCVFSSITVSTFNNPSVLDLSSCVLFRAAQDSRFGSSTGSPLVYLYGDIQASFTKTIFYGGPATFSVHVVDDIRSDDRRKVKLNMDSCVIYNETCVATNQESSQKKIIAHDLKDIRKVFSGTVNMKGKVVSLKPEFVKPPEEIGHYMRVADMQVRTSNNGNESTHNAYWLVQRTDCLGLQLADNSPGKDVGAGIILPNSMLPTGVDNNSLPGAVAPETAKKPAPAAKPETAPKVQPASQPKEDAKAGDAKIKPSKPEGGGKSDDDDLLKALKKESDEAAK